MAISVENRHFSHLRVFDAARLLVWMLSLDEKEWSDNDVSKTENVVVSYWREVSADEKHEVRDKVDEILYVLLASRQDSW